MAADDELRAMLTAREMRASIQGVAAEARRFAVAHPRRPLTAPGFRIALIGAASALAVVGALAFVVAVLPTLRPAIRATAPPSAPSSAASAPSQTPMLARRPPVMTVEDLALSLAEHPGEMTGRVVVVTGRLVRPAQRCAAGANPLECPPVMLDGVNGTVRPVGDIGPGPWSDGKPMSGTFAVQVRSAEPPVQLDFIGLVRPPKAGLAWSIADLVAAAPPAGPDFYPVHGWIVQTPLHPCASSAAANPYPGLEYGCPAETYVTDERFEPERPNGSVVGPSVGLYVQNGNGGLTPFEGDFLVQRIALPPCGPTADCFVGPQDLRWRLLAVVAPAPGLPTKLAPRTTIGDLLVARPPNGAEFVVDAWLVATPPLRCPVKPRPSGVPNFDCDEADWLTDEPFQPWSGGSARNPERAPGKLSGIGVPNGSYAKFAADPHSLAGGALEPRFGTYLVRSSVHSTCEWIVDPTVVCAGGPIWIMEIVARLSP
jgi:hypothetical protein